MRALREVPPLEAKEEDARWETSIKKIKKIKKDVKGEEAGEGERENAIGGGKKSLKKLLVLTMYPAVEWITPLGFPVDPDVYSLNRGCSAPTHSIGAESSAGCRASASCHHSSLPASKGTSALAAASGLSSTRTRSTLCGSDALFAHLATAASTTVLSGIGFAPRRTADAVSTILDFESPIRAASASAEKPPKTTEWTAPRRAQASIAAGSSGTIGMYRVTSSPFLTPFARSQLAMRTTWSFNCAYVVVVETSRSFPSKRKATRSPSPASTCLSTQL